MKGLAVLFVLLLVIGYSIQAQQSHHFRDYSANDGMPTNRIMHLTQDGLGFIWIGHETHISRFDGYNFKTYMHVPGDSMMNFGQSLFGRLSTDRLGDVWINNFQTGFEDKYIARYDRRSDGFIFYKPDVQNLIVSMERDPKRPVMWMGGRDGTGLYEFNFEKDTTTNYQNHFDDSLKNVKANTVLNIDDRGTYLLLGTRLGVWKFIKATGSFERPKFPNTETKELFENNWVNIPTYQKNWQWMWSAGIHYKVDSMFNIQKVWRMPQSLQKIGSDMDVDSKDVHWVTSAEGLFRVEFDNQEPVKILDDKKDTFLRSITIDRDENIWLAGAGLRLFLSHHQQTKVVSTASANAYDTRNLQKLPDGGLYDVILFGADGGWDYNVTVGKIVGNQLQLTGLVNKDREKTKGNYVKSVLGKEYVWSATWDAGVFGVPYKALNEKPSYKSLRHILYDPKNPYTINSNRAWAVYEDQKNNLWVGTFSGLAKVNLSIQYGNEGSVVRYEHDDDDSTTLSHNTVRQILGNGTDTLFVSTEKTVDLFAGGTFQHIFKDQYRVSTILKTSRKTLMVFTDGGVYESDKAYKNFTKIIPYAAAWENSIVEAPNKTIWMGTELGLMIYDPFEKTTTFKREFGETGEAVSSLSVLNDSTIALTGWANTIQLIDIKTSRNKRQVIPQLVSIKVNNEFPLAGAHPGNSEFRLPADITVLDVLELDHRHNYFTIEFSAMDFTEPEQNLYKHMLQGFDNDWVLSDAKNRTATYTNLPSGEYTFRLRASNYDGVWSEKERTLKVIIHPPPWRTWWAYTGYGLLFAGLLVWARRNIVQKERLSANLQLAKVEQEKEHFELEKAKEVDRIKTSFFTNISHEFRTPLTLIKGPVQDLLEKYTSDPKTQEKLKLVQRNSDLLLKLINQLLDLAKLESGSLKVEKTEGDVNSFVRAIASSFESFAKQKDVSIVVDVPSTPLPAMFDKDKVETVLINLINNAIKFTPSSGTVAVKLEQPASNNGQLTLRVKDTGIGIPPDQQQKIFARFHQVSEAHKEVGTGIGLALVKELVTLMGGTIEVHSEIGKGSEFTLSLPIEVVTGSEVQVVESESVTSQRLPITGTPETGNRQPVTIIKPNEDGESTKPHILVVEDNTDLRAFIIDSLGSEFQFLEAENGIQGLQKATEEIPDLIISDVMMPEMDGITMATKIKGDSRTSHIPLILLTAKSSEDNKLQGLQSGADDYLTKPFNKQELLLKVRNGVARQQKLRDRLRAELISTTAVKQAVLSNDEKFLQNVKEKILERISDEQLSVESLAEDIGISRVHLYRKVSGLTGISVNELIRKLRLLRAAQLLQQKWGPVSQVAYEVGISNLSYFSKIFKEEFGILPSEYDENRRD